MMEVDKKTGGNWMDMRKALQPETKLEFGNGQKITLGELVGRGGSCLVYNGRYVDSIGASHNVRIKECYPYHIALERRPDGSLEALFEEEKFKAEQERFQRAYEREAEVKQIPGLVNSTGTVSEFLSANGTVYSLLSYEEGQDYSKYKDANLQEVLEHVLAVAKVLSRYHEHGYLHLDIKPENIFVFPETAQHIQLFDFDSVAKPEEIKKEGFRLSCSDGFTAPEQLQGRLDRLGPATDVYALGAVLFYKLFGRKPELKDGGLGAVYDFSGMLYQDERYQNRLFRELTAFFRKTIATATVVRWQRMDLLIARLEKLIPLSDATKVSVKDNFTYSSGCFVGRHGKLAQLQQSLKQQDMVFLAGIGGIGKTELARRYAYINRDIYDRVFFVPFSDTIEDTICSRDILICNEAWEEGCGESLFDARMRILKEDLTKEDLFILDNFDVSEDEQLERLLECKCKFIITTRNDFRDYNYPQIDVDWMEKESEVRALFCAYNHLEYSEEEWQSIMQIMKLVENHTMTVELIAKHMRDSGVRPSQLLSQMMEKEGITSLQEQEVKHRKDKKMREQNVNRHLLCLFDLSGFSGEEAELMRSLSLLGYVRILRSSFLEYCDVEQKEEALEHLTKTGWVKYDKKSGKISLHQIILDLVYNYMDPTAENCPRLIDGMCKYLQEDAGNWVERGNRTKLVDSLLKRLKGCSLSYARLCVLFGKEPYMEVAERICLESGSGEAKELLYQICLWKMGKIVDLEDMFEIENETWNVYYGRKIGTLLETAEKAEVYVQEYSAEPGYLAKALVELAEGLYRENGFLLNLAEKYSEDALQRLYDRVVDLFTQAEPLVMNSALNNRTKERLLEAMRNFYGDAIITDNYRKKYYYDVDKAWHYQQLIRSVKEPEDSDWITMADKAFAYGEFDEALKCYEQELQEGKYFTHYALHGIADIYQKRWNYAKATEYLLRVIEWGKQEGDFDVYAYCELIDVLLKRKKIAEAKEYAGELSEYVRNNFKGVQEESLDSEVFMSVYRLYQAETDKKEKETLWKHCVKFFTMLSSSEQIEDTMLPFLVEYAEHQQEDVDKVRTAIGFTDRIFANFCVIGEKSKILLDYAQGVCETGKVPAKEQIEVYLRLAKSMRASYPAKSGKAVAYSKQAQKLWQQYFPENRYLESKVYDSLAESFWARRNCNYERVKQLRKRCDYYLVAKTEEAENTAQQQLELWKWAVEGYHDTEDEIMEANCQEHVVSLLEWPECVGYEGCSEDDRFREYWNELIRLLKQYATLQETEKIIEQVRKGYAKLLTFFRYNCEEDEPEMKAEDMEWDIRYVAESFQEAGCNAEALVFFTVANYAGVITEPDWAVLEAVPENMKEVTEPVLAALWMAFNTGIAPRQIDLVSENYGRMKQLLQETAGFAALKDLMEAFSKQYEKGSVEFRREE